MILFIYKYLNRYWYSLVYFVKKKCEEFFTCRYISDSCLGRFKSIVLGFILYIVGFLLLTLTSVDKLPTYICDNHEGVYLAILTFLAHLLVEPSELLLSHETVRLSRYF